MLLRGLKKYPVNLSADVSVADDGGSNGMLRDELGVLPPADAKQCILALSNCSQTIGNLMDYRFSEGKLAGHNFGNIFISALEKTQGTFSRAIEEASKILDVAGEVIPVSDDDMRLGIKLKNGKKIFGERFLDYHKDIHSIGLDRIFLKKKVRANPQAILKIKKADFIIIGPGDHFGSIVPNLLVSEISKAIENSKAKVIYICNITNKKGQTIGYNLDRYVQEIDVFIGKDRIDTVIYNSSKLDEKVIKLYEKLEGKNSLVDFNRNDKKKRNFEVIEGKLLQNKKINISKKDLYARKHSFIRHDSAKLARVIMKII
jgi:uncharacterized cofD-like protein